MRKNLKLWGKLLPFVLPYLKYDLLLLLLLLVGNISALVSPYFLKIIVDQVIPNRDVQLLVNISLALLIVYTVRVTFQFLSDYLYTWISTQIMREISTKLFNHVLQLPLSYFKNTSIGDTVHRVNNEVNQIQRALTGSIISFINNAITVIGLLVLLGFLDLKLLLVISLVYPFLFMTIRGFDPRITKAAKEVKEGEANLLAHHTERFLNIKSIKTFYTYSHEGALLKKKIDGLVRRYIRVAMLVSGSKSGSLYLLSLIPLISLSWGGWQVLAGSITLGTLIAFLQYVNKLHQPFQNLVNVYIELINTTVSIRRVFELLEQPLEHEGVATPVIPLGALKKISFERVSFAHPQKPILHEINFTIEVGKHYALVGASGCGKSTLIDLLCKFYAPTAGMIKINGTDLQTIHPGQWRNQIAVSNQGAFLFNDTMLENMRYGSFTTEPGEVLKTSKLVKLMDENVHTTDHLLKEIGDGGARLSGGQKQKISLARMLLNNKELLILDEATSEIDSNGEENIYNYLFNHSGYKTVIIISHRLSSIKGVDEIICLDEGRIVEKGTLDELIGNRKHFYTLFEEQLQIVPA